MWFVNCFPHGDQKMSPQGQRFWKLRGHLVPITYVIPETHTHTRFEQLLELIACVLEYREASAESALWKPSSADCALTSCDLLVFVRLCVFVVLMTFFLFSLDDLPMGTVGRRPSSEFLLCGGWVWHHWYGSLTMHYNAFTHACLLASNVKQGL